MYTRASLFRVLYVGHWVIHTTRQTVLSNNTLTYEKNITDITFCFHDLGGRSWIDICANLVHLYVDTLDDLLQCLNRVDDGVAELEKDVL